MQRSDSFTVGRQSTLILPLLLLALTLLSGCRIANANPLPAPTAAPYDDVAPSGSASTPTSKTPPPPSGEKATDPSPTPYSTEIDDTGERLYTSEVVAAEEVVVSVEVGGRVTEMNVQVGDEVRAGQPLLRLETTTLEAQRADALATLQAAQAQAELLQLKASDIEIEAARAEVAAAEAAYQRLIIGTTEDELALAKSRLLLAETNLRRAQVAYDQLAWNPLIATMPENARLQEALSDLAAAQAHYDFLIQGASEQTITDAYAKLASARANLQRLEDGPDASAVEAAEAEVRQAETALYLAQLQLDKAVVAAPVDAIVAETYLAIGETAQAGSPAFLLISPEVQIEIMVEERRIVHLQVGQPARIQVEGYPEQDYKATISGIAPQLDSAMHTVRVTVRPIDTSAPLLPGMRANVELLPPTVE